MKKESIDFVFVILTYRNTNDLLNFIECTKKNVKDSFKLIIVNSYYDHGSLLEFKKIAEENNCDFLNVENKGYGYGNNKGIEYARLKYLFKFLIISNPDIEITKMTLDDLDFTDATDCLIAPLIKTLKGKSQNPYYYKDFKLVEWLMYYSHKKKKRSFFYFSVSINKLIRESFLIVNKCLKMRNSKIYAAHGSFLIVGKNALSRLGKLYDERMFLFCEENHLARLALKKSVKTMFIPSIKVLHKEDGSVGIESTKNNKYMRESFITYYENWENADINA